MSLNPSNTCFTELVSAQSILSRRKHLCASQRARDAEMKACHLAGPGPFQPPPFPK